MTNSRSRSRSPRRSTSSEPSRRREPTRSSPANSGEDSASESSEAEEGEADSPREQPPSDPPLPNEPIPPLPHDAPPQSVPAADDGWDPMWDASAQAYYFYNRFTGLSQWTNPRVPEATSTAPGVANHDRIEEAAPGTERPPSRPHGGYDPAIHGDYDPTASYAQEVSGEKPVAGAPTSGPEAIYTATGVFNRFTGKWQPHDINPENHNDENKSRRQMSAFFDVDAAANSHNGKSLKAERSGKKLSKQELKAFKEKRKEKKEEKRRAWLRD